MAKRPKHRKKKGMSARRIKCAWKSAKRRGKKRLDKKAKAAAKDKRSE